MSWKRVTLTAILLVGLTLGFHAASHGENAPLHRPLNTFPDVIAGREGKDVKLDPRLTENLKADDVLTRIYSQGDLPAIGLYIAYFESQRQGQTIHSPKNCLPGAGWMPMQSRRQSVDVGAGQKINLNRYVIQNGLDRHLVLYWYQSHGRTVASEYAAKLDMAMDAIRLNRTDGALIRISIPIENEDEAKSEKIADEFLRGIYPRLVEYIPQ